MSQSAVRELTDRVNASLDRSKRELIAFAQLHRTTLEDDLRTSGEVVLQTKDGARLRLTRDKAGKLRVP